MNLSERVPDRGPKNMMDNKVQNTCYMVDEQGKEVQITTAMVHHICTQLLNQCRTIKK